MPQIVDQLIAAGQEALAAGHWPEARDVFERVLEERKSPEAFFGLGEALWWLGDMRGTMDNFERAYVEFRHGGDLGQAAGVALWIGFHSLAHLGNRAAAEGWLGRAGRLIEENEIQALCGELRLMQAAVAEDPVEAEATAREALALGREAGDPDLELCALSRLGTALVEQGRIGEGMSLLDEAMAGSLGGEPARLDTVVFTSCNMMVSCSKCAAFERAVEWVRASERFARRYGCPFLFAECRLVYGSVLLATGRWAEAERELIAAIDLSGDSIPAFHAEACAALAELRLAQGRLEEAERLVAGLDGHEGAVPVVARLHLVGGRPDLAAATAARHLDGRDGLRLDGVRLEEILGEAEIAQGDDGAAAERGRSLAEAGASRGCRIAVARGERLTGRALGAHDPVAARRHLDAALIEFTRLEMPFEAARTRLLLAKALADVERELAAAEAGVALDVFERLGATMDRDSAAALLRELGVRAPRSGPRTEGALTRRETEVLALLGEGLSNPEIAERLFISRKTVEHHVASVLGKLGLRNRAEAAGEAIRRGTERSAR